MLGLPQSPLDKPISHGDKQVTEEEEGQMGAQRFLEKISSIHREVEGWLKES